MTEINETNFQRTQVTSGKFTDQKTTKRTNLAVKKKSCGEKLAVTVNTEVLKKSKTNKRRKWKQEFDGNHVDSTAQWR